MSEVLISYPNGNYNVTILNDGTKIRSWNNDIIPTPIIPETIDIKITNFCNLEKICEYCHENSNHKGLHADFEFLKTLSNPSLRGMEWAIGGGDPLSYPNLKDLLELNKQNEIISNLTVNELHIDKNYDLICELLDKNLIRGLGISFREKNKDRLLIKKLCEKYDTIVWHVILGIVSFGQILELINEIRDIKILLLGYKKFRNGVIYLLNHNLEISKNITTTYRKLPLLFQNSKVISFDNLAIDQLNVKRLFTDEGWEKFYMGDDGTFSMYIDAVEKRYAKSSTSNEMFNITMQNFAEMFGNLK